MRKLIIGVALLSAVAAFAQTSFDEIRENPLKAGGIYLAYPVTESANTPAPKGYEPFYVSHYARHGSRYLISDNDYKWVMDLFDKASAEGALTPLGQSVDDRLHQLWPEAEGRGGDLSPLGARQHKGIAKRMYRAYPQVFADGAEMTARSTVVLRCALSMAAFCEGLKEENPKLEIPKESSNRWMNYLNFHSDESNHFTREGGDWYEENRKFREAMTQPDRLVSALFSKPEFVLKNVNPDKVMWGLYWIAVDTQNMETPVELTDIFTPEELFQLWQAHNYSFYVTNSNPPSAKGLLLSNAKPQLKNMLESAQQKIRDGRHGADLRFGHDGNLIPLAGLLNLHDCYGSESDPYKLYQVYSDFKIAPMAGNIQIVFFRPKDAKKRSADGSDVLVKFMLNEREVAVDALPADNFPFYRWPDVEAYWTNLIHEAPTPVK
ncbi:MAG: histidine-type phosphatase [Muribaculaceae bacterium]|nr:histidine-type phosphatase [Muribaculaceae bacterium]